MRRLCRTGYDASRRTAADRIGRAGNRSAEGIAGPSRSLSLPSTTHGDSSNDSQFRPITRVRIGAEGFPHCPSIQVRSDCKDRVSGYRGGARPIHARGECEPYRDGYDRRSRLLAAQHTASDGQQPPIEVMPSDRTFNRFHRAWSSRVRRITCFVIARPLDRCHDGVWRGGWMPSRRACHSTDRPSVGMEYRRGPPASCEAQPAKRHLRIRASSCCLA